MRIALDASDVPVDGEVLEVVNREVTERATSPRFRGVSDVRVRLRRLQGSLLCVVAVGFAGGALVTSTATSKSQSPREVIVGALDGLPERLERREQRERDARARGEGHGPGSHALVRAELKRLLERA